MYTTSIMDATQANQFWRLFKKTFPSNACDLTTVGCTKFYLECEGIETEEAQGQCAAIEMEVLG